MGGPVFNIVFNSLSYSIMYFCFKLRSKYLWSPVPHMRSLQPAALMSCGWAADELRAQFGILEWRIIAVFCFGLYRKCRKFLPVGLPAGLTVLQRQPRVGYLALTIRSVWLGLNVQTFRLAIHLNLFLRRLCLRYAESSKGIAFISFTSWFKPCCFL